MNYIEHLVTVQCSSGKPWNLALTWMYQPAKHIGRPSKPSHGPTLPNGNDLPAGLSYMLECVSSNDTLVSILALLLRNRH